MGNTSTRAQRQAKKEEQIFKKAIGKFHDVLVRIVASTDDERDGWPNPVRKSHISDLLSYGNVAPEFLKTFFVKSDFLNPHLTNEEFLGSHLVFPAALIGQALLSPCQNMTIMPYRDGHHNRNILQVLLWYPATRENLLRDDDALDTLISNLDSFACHVEPAEQDARFDHMLQHLMMHKDTNGRTIVHYLFMDVLYQEDYRLNDGVTRSMLNIYVGFFEKLLRNLWQAKTEIIHCCVEPLVELYGKYEKEEDHEQKQFLEEAYSQFATVLFQHYLAKGSSANFDTSDLPRDSRGYTFWNDANKRKVVKLARPDHFGILVKKLDEIATSPFVTCQALLKEATCAKDAASILQGNGSASGLSLPVLMLREVVGEHALLLYRHTKTKVTDQVEADALNKAESKTKLFL